MKYLIFFAFVISSLQVTAQTYPVRSTDSSYYYQREIGKLRKKMYDSLLRSEEYQTLNRNYQAYIRRSDGYTALVLFTEAEQANYTKFNNNITASGFSAIDGRPVIRFGFGISNKKNRKIVDFNFFSLDLGKNSKKGDEKISTFFSNAIIFYIGYDLVKNQQINIYPYGGLSFRTATINYTKPVIANPSFTDITNLIQNNQSVYASALKIGFQAGVGFDFVLNPMKKNINGGTIIFIKAGINKAIGKEKYTSEGPDYIPGISYGNWAIAVGFKFFGRN